MAFYTAADALTSPLTDNFIEPGSGVLAPTTDAGVLTAPDTTDESNSPSSSSGFPWSTIVLVAAAVWLLTRRS